MMSKDDVIFYMAEVDKHIILDTHKFYVREAQNRLIHQFDSLDKEMEIIVQQYIESSKKSFNPDSTDFSNLYESAIEYGNNHCLALSEMKDTVLLALTANMFHQFDKTLRQKIISEMNHSLNSEFIQPLVWDINFIQLIELLDWIGINIKETNFIKKIDTCRLLVNVYKHGDGAANKQLFKNHPEYYSSHITDLEYNPHISNQSYEFLQVKDHQFIEFSEAIIEFWKSLPTYTYESQVKEPPSWLEKKYIKFENKIEKTS
jgi:hypothetical protein